MVKRGCAKKDRRYNNTGCEEQITGAGNFGVLLCLCKEDACNAAGPKVVGMENGRVIAAMAFTLIKLLG